MVLLESFLKKGSSQVIAIRVDWAKWGQFFRGLQENPLLERIFSSVEGRAPRGATGDWRLKIASAAPEDREAIIGQAVREMVGSVLRVMPDALRDDQPLTDIGLDSLMGVEIENSLESSLGVALPPSSLMRARTIGQIVTLIAEHLGAKTAAGHLRPDATPAEPAAADEVDLEALSDEEVDRLLGDDLAPTDNARSCDRQI